MVFTDWCVRSWPRICVRVTGSFNFTKAAEQSNAENLLVIRDPGVSAQYRANWQEHSRHAVPYAGRQGTK